MKQLNKEGLKREFYDWHYVNRDTVHSYDICEWWLDKLAQSIAEYKEYLLDEIGRMKGFYHYIKDKENGEVYIDVEEVIALINSKE